MEGAAPRPVTARNGGIFAGRELGCHVVASRCRGCWRRVEHVLDRSKALECMAYTAMSIQRRNV